MPKHYQPTPLGETFVSDSTTASVGALASMSVSKQPTFKYANGIEVPTSVVVQKVGMKWLAKEKTGDVQVFSPDYFYRSHFKYLDGSKVPPDIKICKMGQKWFAEEGDGEVEVFLLDAARARTLRSRELRRQAALSVKRVPAPLESAAEVGEATADPTAYAQEGAVAGISDKYLADKIPCLPKRGGGEIPESVLEQFSSRLVLVKLCEEAPVEKYGPLSNTPMILHGALRFDWYTFKPEMRPTDKLIFIISGRKEEAYIPQILDRNASSVHIILVGPREDFERLRGVLRPGVDFLVLDEIASLTHGRYEQLGLPNARRIGAFCFGLYARQRYGINEAFMLDDNIQSIHCKALGIDSWEDCFAMLMAKAREEHAVCVSLGTISNNGLRSQRVGELGSKFYWFDLEVLYEALGKECSNWISPFFPATANAFWGEDYYFQLFLKALFAERGQKGYAVLDKSEFGLRRASLPSLCRNAVRTADALLRVEMKDLFGDGLGRLLPEVRGYVEQTVGTLKTIIRENIQLHESLLRHSRTKDLMMAHAWANRLVYNADASIPAIDDTVFLAALATQLVWVEEHGHLYGYQKEILKAVAASLGGSRLLCQLKMATGTGKTYVQIYLAIAALLTGTRRPVVIVMPHQHLVNQAYEDFIRALQSFPDSPIAPQRVLKVDSQVSSIAAETLLKNRTLDGKSCVLIFCEDSYLKVQQSEDEAMDPYQHPCLLLLDEAHMLSSVVDNIETSHPHTQHCLIAGLTATPKKEQALWSLKESGLIEYSRHVAVDHDYLTPCILDRLDVDYSRAAVVDIIKEMPKLLGGLLPSGGKLLDKKGIIYVPNNAPGVNYSKQLRHILELVGFPCFEINSNEPDSQVNLETFKNHLKEDGPKILICKRMAKVGFSDSNVHWIIYLQKGDASQFAQSAGRTMRMLNPAKIAYVLAFRDVRTELVFEQGITADEKALARCTEDYRLQRANMKGMITLNAPQPMVCEVDEDGVDEEVMECTEISDETATDDPMDVSEDDAQREPPRGEKRKLSTSSLSFFAPAPEEKRLCLLSKERTCTEDGNVLPHVFSNQY